MQNNTPAADDVTKLAPQATLVQVPNLANCDQQLHSKHVDAVAGNDAQLMTMRFNDANTRIAGLLSTTEPSGIAIKKGHPEFVQFINDLLANMEQDGRWKASYTTWLSTFTPVSADDALQRVLNQQ